MSLRAAPRTTTVDVNRECEDPTMLDRDVLFVHMTQSVWICNCRHGCRHGSCLVQLVHCTNSVITIFGKMSSLAANNTCGRISNSLCSLTHKLFLSLCPCLCLYLWAVPCPCHSYLCLCSCPVLWVSFTLADSVHVHVVRTSVPGFFSRASNPRSPVSLSCSRCQCLQSVTQDVPASFQMSV